MLPEHISNQLCSLRPNEDKLTFSAIFQMNAFGAVPQRIPGGLDIAVGGGSVGFTVEPLWC